MPDTRISALSASTARNSGDRFPVVQTAGVGPVTHTLAQIATFTLDGGGGVTATLPVANGGTGVTTSTGTGSVVLGTTPTFTTSALFPAGTLSAPGISVSGDTNTGIYFPAADTIGFVEGGFEAMRINSSGNVGIGTTPLTNFHVGGAGHILQAYNGYIGNNIYFSGGWKYVGNGFGSLIKPCDSTDGSLIIWQSSNNTSGANAAATLMERMRIDSSGNLLVGTTSAGTLLTVNGVATLCSGTATPAAGSTSARLLFGTTAGFGIYYGSGAPTVSAAQGSIYLRSDGSSTSTRLYVNSSSGSGTTWTNVTTAA